MRDVVQVKLPEAPPEAYLAWVDWWRTVERVMQRLELMTSTTRGGGPKLLHGAVPGYLSRVFLEELRRQASHAQRCGNEAVGPLLRADARMMWDASGVLEEQARWIDAWLQDGVVSARLGLTLPGWRVELLRGRVVASMREQVQRHHLGAAARRAESSTRPARRHGELILTLLDTDEPDHALTVHLN
jgi:hypothetical protein